MFRFIHAADLHLDSQCKNLKEKNQTIGNRLQRATFDAYETLIDLCIEKEVSFLVIAGDVFDGETKSLQAQLKFRDGLVRLDKHGINAFICHGNHDPLDSWKANLSFPTNVHQFKEQAEQVPGYVDGSIQYRVCGISYPTKQIKHSLLNKFPKPDWPEFTIGLLHANVGNNDRHEPYAPCTVEELTELGYDYWALGHVHTRVELQQNHPWIGYPGNSQGRSPIETGPRGVYVVEVGDDKRVTPEFVAVHAVLWEQHDVSIDGLETVDQLDERIQATVDEISENAGERDVVYRIHLVGRGLVHRDLTEENSPQEWADRLNGEGRNNHEPLSWCAGVKITTTYPHDLDRLRKGEDVIGDFLKLTNELAQDETLTEQVKQELSELFAQRNAKRYLKEVEGAMLQDVQTLLKQAESKALDLLISDNHD